MALSLGGASAVATISLNIAPLEAAVQRATGLLQGLGNTRLSGLDNVGKSIDSVGKHIDSLRGTKIDIDAAPAVSELKDVTEAVADVETAVEKVADADIKLDMGNAKAEVQETEQAVKSLGDRMHDLEGSINQVGGALSIVGGGITAAFAVATKSAISFEASMANVQSISGSSNKELGQLEDEIMKISKVTATGPQELSVALYDVVSSGFEAEDALTVLNASAIAAKAGITSTAVAVKGISAVLNAYQLDASEAGNVSDALFAVVDQGVVSFEELSRNMGQVLPLAATLKVSIQELAAAYSLLTLRGISPAESETAIAAVMRSAINPTTQLTEAVKSYGFASAEALIQAQGFAGYLNVLQTASGGSAEALTTLLGTADATTAVLALLSNNGQDYTAALNEMTAATQNGATTQQVFDTQMESTAGKLANASAAFGRLKVDVGNALSPIVSVAAQTFTGLVSLFERLPGPVQAAISVFGSLVGVITLTAGAALLATPRIIALVEAFQTLAKIQLVASALSKVRAGMTALSLAASPVGLIILGITAAVAAGVYVWKTYNDAINSTSRAFESFDAAQQQALLNGDKARAAAIEKAKKDFDTYGAWLDEQMGVGQFASSDHPNGPMIPGVNRDTYDSVLKSVSKALSDSRVDVTKYTNWLGEELQKAYANPGQSQQIFEGILETNATGLGQFSIAMDDAAASAKNASDFIGNHGLGKAVADTNKLLDDAASRARNVGDAYAELYRAENGKYPAGDDQRRYNDLLAERAKLERDLQAAINAGDDALITSLTSDLSAANDQADELLAKLLAVQSALAMDGTTGLIDSGFANVDAKNAERLAERNAQWAVIGAQAGNALADANVRVAQTAAEATARISAFGDATTSAATKAAQFAADAVEMAVKARDMLDTFHEMRGVDSFLGDWNLTSHATEASKLAENIQSTGYAIDNTTRVIIGNTNAIEQQVSGLNDWATGLIGVRGEASALDDLLAANRIDSGQYEAAQQAQEQIAAGYESIKTSIQDIQATAAPILGDLVEQQAAYLESLSALPPQQQLVALGWMDGATSAKAYQLYTQAAAVANGDFGASGEGMFTQMITGAAQADPVLKAMLLDMGLISEGADGTITVNFDSAKGATSEIAELTKSIDALIVALGGVPPLHVDPGNLPAVKGTVDAVTGAAGKAAGAVSGLGQVAGAAGTDVDTLNGRIAALGNQHAEPTVAVETGDADAQLQTISDLITPLDGKEVLTRVKVLLDDESGGGMAKYDQQGGGRVVHLKSVLDPPEGLPDYSGVPPVKVKTEYDQLPPLDVPTPDPIVVPVQFNVNTAGGLGPSKVPGGMESAIGGGAGGGSAITIDVTVTVTGAEQLDAVQSKVDTLNTTPVTIPVSVTMSSTVAGIPSWLSPWLPSNNPAGGAASFTPITITVSAKVGNVDTTSLDSLKDKSITITQTGAEAVAAAAAIAHGAVAAIPTSWSTAISQSGGEDLAATAAIAHAAIAAIPTAWNTAFSSTGADGVIGAANSIAAAVSAIPTSKTVTVSIATSGSVPKLAKGGYVPGVGPTATIARMGERGPELFRTPQGRWGLARTDGLYPMVPGSYVYTASRTRNMLRRWDGPAYANGGRVATPTASAQRGTSGASNTMIHVAPNVTVNPQSTLTDREMDHITEQVSGAIVTAVQTRRYARGGPS